MVNTELNYRSVLETLDYNILNIVVNTELNSNHPLYLPDYNILNIVVNTEQMLIL